ASLWAARRGPSGRLGSLMSEDRRGQLEQLAATLARHERLYRAGQPELTDAEFDALEARYAELADELGLPERERLDRRVADEHTEGFETVTHELPMLSLEKLRPGDGVGVLAHWAKSRRREIGLDEDAPLDLLVEPKVDGISLSLHYEDGQLVRAVTRGDGR